MTAFSIAKKELHDLEIALSNSMYTVTNPKQKYERTMVLSWSLR